MAESLMKKQGVAELLNTGLEAVRGRRGIVVPDRLAALAQRALAVLRPEEEPGLDDAREHEHGLGLASKLTSVGHGGIHAGQGRVHVAVDLRPGSRAGGSRGYRQVDRHGERHRQQAGTKSHLEHRPLSWDHLVGE